MWYYWLVAILILAIIAIVAWSFAGKRRIDRPGTSQAGGTEAIRRGEHLNS